MQVPPGPQCMARGMGAWGIKANVLIPCGYSAVSDKLSFSPALNLMPSAPNLMPSASVTLWVKLLVCKSGEISGPSHFSLSHP